MQKKDLRICKVCGKEPLPKGKGILKDICRKCYDKKYQDEYYIKNYDKIITNRRNRKKKNKQSYGYYKDYLNKDKQRKINLYISQMTYHKYGKAEKCQICGNKNKVHHHHFTPYDIDNFIDVCSICHKKYFHRKHNREEIKQKIKEKGK